MTARILFVDDEPRVLQSLQRMLHKQRDEWEMTFVDTPQRVVGMAEQQPYDVIVSDIRMPGLSGLELLEALQQNDTTEDIVVIILTGEADRTLKRQALDLGATDLLNKPVDREDLLARLRSAVRLKACQDELKFHNARLEQAVEERTRDLAASRVEIIWRLGKAAEFRDEETGNHVVRVGCYSRIVAETMGLDVDFIDDLFLAAPLHDLGKIGIPDQILLKPGRLTDDEMQVMRGHCRIGAEILNDDAKVKEVFTQFGGSRLALPECENSLLKLASSIALYHHEKWDGGGYPHGVSGDQIPLEARIVAIADVYDALCSERPYKRAFTIEEALVILDESAGTHFDPDVHEAFRSSTERIQEVQLELSDPREVEVTVGECV